MVVLILTQYFLGLEGIDHAINLTSRMGFIIVIVFFFCSVNNSVSYNSYLYF